MAIDLFISPEETLQSGEIRFENIPMLAYKKTMAEEKNNFSKEELIGIYHDMMVIREFEEMLIATKIMGEYKGINVYANAAGFEQRLTKRQSTRFL